MKQQHYKTCLRKKYRMSCRLTIIGLVFLYGLSVWNIKPCLWLCDFFSIRITLIWQCCCDSQQLVRKHVTVACVKFNCEFKICFCFNFFSDMFCSRAGAGHVRLKETLVLFSSRHKVCFSFSPFYKFIGWSKVFASVSICHRCFNTQHATVVKQVNVTRRYSEKVSIP